MRSNCVERLGYSSEYQEVPKHFHKGMEFIFILEGKIELTVKGASFLAGKDSLVLLNHLDEHEIQVLEAPYYRYFLILDSYHTGRMLADPELLLILRNGPSRVLNLDSSAKEEAAWIFKRLTQEQEAGDSFCEEQMNSLIRELFVLVCRRERVTQVSQVSPGAATVTQVQDYIDGHFYENLKIAELAEIFFMSKYYLSHLFRQTTGYTVKEYLTLTRLAHARLLLTTTQLKINEVCFESGFNDVNSFIRSFRDAYGCTPLTYRKEAGKTE